MSKATAPSALNLARDALTGADAMLEAAAAAARAADEALAQANGVLEATSPENPAERRQARIARDDASELAELRQSQLKDAKARVAESEEALKELIRAAWDARRDAARKRLEDAILELVPEFWRSSLQCGAGFANLECLLRDVARSMARHPTWESAEPVPELALRLATPEA